MEITEITPAHLTGAFFAAVLSGDPQSLRSLAACTTRLRPNVDRLRVQQRLKRPGARSLVDHLDAALIEAACRGGAQRLSMLLALGADPNAVDKITGMAPVHIAINRKFQRCLSVLLEFGADPELRNSAGETPLTEAACANWVEGISVLIGAGARTSTPSMTGNLAMELTTCRDCQALLDTSLVLAGPATLVAA